MTAELAPRAAAAAGAIRVLVVDDSAVVRGLISRQLGSHPEIEIVATAANGQVALDELRRKSADVVVLDVDMPVMDGLTALPPMLAQHPGLRVIMVSTLTRRNADISLKALQLGASDYVPKPEAGLGGAEEFHRELLHKVRALAPRRAKAPSAPVVAAPVVAAPTPTKGAATVKAVPRPFAQRPSAVAIGSSTGGPPALLRLFEHLRGAVEHQPIVLTQHMPPTFTALLAEQLARAGERPCAEARDGEPLVNGRCYIAPGGWHLTVERQGVTPTIRLNQEPPENFCRPAVDPMLRSMSRAYGPALLAIILTGMGADGAKGCEAVAASGGRFIVQDEATSVVWGMPGAAAATGRAEAILPLDQIGPWTRRVTGATA
jgi:two-component system chemotaxis response regulator CheB